MAVSPDSSPAVPPPGIVGVHAASPGELARATELAHRLGVPLSDTLEPGLQLVLRADRLELRDGSPGAPGALWVDLADHARRATGASWRRDPLARAAGLRRHGRPSILDATLGLGRDTWLLASLGCCVRSAERSPVVRALVEDAWARSALDARLASVAERVTIYAGDAQALLEQCRAVDPPDVVLLDPMFPDRRKSAQVRREMQLVQRLLGPDGDASALLRQSLGVARQRVLVKRPKGAPVLDGGRAPSHAVDGRSLRFDVYLVGGSSP